MKYHIQTIPSYAICYVSELGSVRNLELEIISFILKLVFRSVKECLNGKVGDIGCPRDEEIERTKPCFFDECPHYSEWYSWTLCSKSCGGGIHQRHRICKHGDIGDLGCPPGQDQEHQNCEEDPCPHWGSWTRWSPCDKKCGRGYQIARRGCEFGYKNLSGCRGPDLKRKLCFKHCKELGSKGRLASLPSDETYSNFIRLRLVNQKSLNLNFPKS